MEMQTIALDPIVFNDRRAEFLLPDDYYDSASMVLSNLGMFAPDITKANTRNLYYPITCGVAGVISKYTLLSGADEIEMLDHVVQWATIKALNNQDTELEDIYHNTLHSGWNFGIIKNTENDQFPGALLTLIPTYVDYVSMPGVNMISAGYQSRISNTQFPPGSSASLRVNMISGFLQATPILPMIRNLRLVIEYDTNTNHYYNQLGGDNIPAQIFPTFPMLIVKKYVTPPPLPSVVTIPYTTVKCADGFFVPAIDAPDEGEVGLISRNTYQSYDFMSKYLKRITMYNAPIDINISRGDEEFMSNNFRSIGQPNEVINFIINGEKYLPDNGIDSPALKLQYLLNAHGNFSIPLLCTAYGLQSYDGVDMQCYDFVANLSLTAINVDTIISTPIQVEYSRQAVVGTHDDTAQSLNILLFGEIAQVVTINADGSITIES
jgi:hypothetical protein